ncbi:MAG: rRNA maturation RNase YbeY [Candidatus Pacebacteria bacterium]|nr:rRNA maturation RNase YbeY [Candidatus Paceibacterota bacterium]
MTLEINTTLKKKYNFLPSPKKLTEIKEKILGKKYELSLVYIGDKLSKKLNKTHRQKDYEANILSFPLDKNSGEIFINIPNSKKTCKKWGRGEKNFIEFLFIHGLSHLKGYDHTNNQDSKKMETFEQKIRKKFKV